MVEIKRGQIKIGSLVRIVLKKDQRTGKLTEGKVKEILTNSPTHPHGIKVRLINGQVGRVKELMDTWSYKKDIPDFLRFSCPPGKGSIPPRSSFRFPPVGMFSILSLTILMKVFSVSDSFHTNDRIWDPFERVWKAKSVTLIPWKPLQITPHKNWSGFRLQPIF